MGGPPDLYCTEGAGVEGPAEGAWGAQVTEALGTLDMSKPWYVRLDFVLPTSVHGEWTIWLMDGDAGLLVLQSMPISQFGVVGWRVTDTGGEIIGPVPLGGVEEQPVFVEIWGEGADVYLIGPDAIEHHGVSVSTGTGVGFVIELMRDRQGTATDWPLRSMRVTGTKSENPGHQYG